jgi:gas vesicle protein
MSDGKLNALERDVEQARARFADDLARLRSPSTLARFKDDAWAEARATKDELVGKTTEAAKDGAQRLFTELKERAAANPVAALAIGAGLAWRLVHKPPIATLLVGMGVVGLLRTSARNPEPYMGLHDEDPRLLHRYGAREPDLAARAGELADVVKDKVQDWSADAGDAARATATQVAEATTAVAERASRALRDVRDVARDAAENVGEHATAAAERASDGLHDARNTARITAAGVSDKAAAVAGQASQAVQDASDTVRETVAHMADRAAVMGQQASARLHDAMPDREHRDTYLLGAAALAVAAAVGVAYQRRSHHAQSADDRR